MKKTIIVGFAILAVSTSGALAKAKGQAKPKTDAAATTTSSPGPFMGDPRRRLGQAVPRDRGPVFCALRGARLVNPGLGRPLSFPLKAVSIRNNY